jgi:hypothetical protein
MTAHHREGEKREIRFGLLYGIVISVLVEYGMLKFFLVHSGRFSRVEDYIQFGLATAVTLFFAALGIRYAVMFVGDLRGRG